MTDMSQAQRECFCVNSRQLVSGQTGRSPIRDRAELAAYRPLRAKGQDPPGLQAGLHISLATECRRLQLRWYATGETIEPPKVATATVHPPVTQLLSF